MSADGDIEVRLLASEEAAQLTGLIRRCYGESYIDPVFYDVEVVRERLAAGRLHSIGAFTERDQLVGHMAITLRKGSERTADAGMTLVDPAYRGKGIARRVAGGLAEQAIALGLVGVHDYPVTVHAATQRIGEGFGVDTGLMLANIPADVVFEEIHAVSPTERSSSLIRWLPFGLGPARDVHLPARYRSQIEALYTACYLERHVVESEARPAGTPSKLRMFLDTRRRTLRTEVRRVGEDFETKMSEELEKARRYGALIGHADLPLSDATSPGAAESLRGLGFFFAGLLPEYRDGDVLRMQWVDDTVSVAEAGVITSPTTRAIEAFVLEDRG